jgi:TPR repeat protein
MDIATKIEKIKAIFEKNSYVYNIIDEKIINVVYDLLINDIVPVPTDDTEVIINIGIYYEIKKDYDNMEKYYLMAIKQKHTTSMNNLGCYYQQKKDYENMMKYYLMAIEEKNKSAMYNLGFYYKKQKDYENMIKYYSMAIKNGHELALTSLSNYFMENNKEKGLYVLYDLYKEGVFDADTKLIELLRVANNKSLLSYIKYIKNINTDLEKRNSEITELKTYITELELAPEGPKYKEAKEHFELLSTMKMS